MRRRVAVAVALPVAAAGAVAAVVAVGGGGAAAPGRAAAAGAGAHGTEVVARRTLVERELVDGTLGYGDARPALDRLGGTLTWLPEAGAVIRPGERLFAVDDRPVVLMDGTVPAWRDLEAGISDGSDVLQLERNLGALGYDPGTIDDQFTSATAAAVVRWQEANDLPETGRVELGRVVFLPGPRRIASVTGSLGSSGGGGGGASGVAWDGGGAPAATRTAAWDGGDARFSPIADTGGAAPSTGDLPATTPSTTPTTPADRPPTQTTPSAGGGDADEPGGGTRGPGGSGGDGTGGSGGSPGGERDGTPPAAGPSTGDAPTVSSSSGGGGGGDGGSGDGGGDGGAGGSAGTEVLETTSTERVVTAQLDAADQALARVGRAAAVTLPSGRTVRGRITAVGTVATGSDDDQGGGGGSGGGGSATLPVTIRLRSPRGAGGLDEAPVSVALARTTRRNVLAVPVQALIARSGGGYAVRVRGRGGGEAAEVPVEPGLSADGWVELLDGAVRAGDRVEVPR